METKIVNSFGKLVYEVLDFDLEGDVIELKDPHTGKTFLIRQAKKTLTTLGYKVQQDAE